MPENEIWVFYSEAEAKLSEARIKDSLMAPSQARLDARAEIMAFIRTSRGRARAQCWHYDNRPWATPDHPLDPTDPLDAWQLEIPEKYRSKSNEIEAEGSGVIPHSFFAAGGRCHFEGDNLVGLKRGAESVMIEVSELKKRAWQRGEEVIFAENAIGSTSQIDENSYCNTQPFTETEMNDWIASYSGRNGDKALKDFKNHPRYNKTKQLEFRKAWKRITGASRGRPINS